MSLYEFLIRPALFKLPPEISYHLATDMLRFWMVWKALAAIGQLNTPNMSSEVAGIPLGSPIVWPPGSIRIAKSSLDCPHSDSAT